MPRRNKRKTANVLEKAMGVQGVTTAFAADMFTNAGARMGFGTPSLGQGAEYTLVRISYDYWQLVTLFRNHWISRRIVEVPAQDCVKAWPKLTSEIEPKDLTRIDRALRKTNTKNNILTGLTWGRLFGGAGGLIAIEGQENELDQPLDIDSVGIGQYKGIIPFDRWAGISPIGDVCTDINRPLDFNKPEMYEVRIAGGESFQVHSSRLLRFLGPTVPTPEVEAQSYWGISVLEPTYESITKLDNMYWNILSLSFRANLLGMKFPELAQLLSGLGSSQMASQKFEQRMSAINHLLSNNSLIPLPENGGIESTSYTFSGLSDVLQLFQLDLAGAAQMPITRLFGRTYSGMGQAGDGDERIYEEKISTDQATYLVPQLEKLYPVICMSELGEVPDDLDLTCPSIRVLSEQEKAELAKAVADTTTVYLNGGIMSPRRVAMEVKQSSATTGIGSNMDDEYIDKLSDDVQSEGELGEGLFGGEGAGLGEADSPAKAIKAENKKEKQGGKEENDEDDAEPKKKASKKSLTKKAGKAKDASPEMDEMPEGLSIGEKILVGGKLLTVSSIGDSVEDLDGEIGVPVLFEDGSVVAYRRAEDAVGAKGFAGSAGPECVTAFRDIEIGDYFVWRFGSELITLKKTGAQEGTDPSDGVRQFISLNYLTTKVSPPRTKRSTDAEETCSHCSGTGKLGAQQCGWCKGTGKLAVSIRTVTEKVLGKDADGPSTKHEAMQLYHGLPVRIETKAGDTRTGPGWSNNMPADYGFIEGINGTDGDSLDCYVGPSPESSNVYVVDQYDLEGNLFDEHKVMLGYHTEDSAKEDYMLGHHKSGKTFAAITAFTMPMFRKWMATADLSKPCNSTVGGASTQ